MSLLDRREHQLSLAEIEARRFEDALYPDGLTGSCGGCGGPMECDGLCPRCATTPAPAAASDDECVTCGRPAPGGACPAHDPWAETRKNWTP